MFTGGHRINRYSSFFMASRPPLNLPFFTFSKPRFSKNSEKRGDTVEHVTRAASRSIPNLNYRTKEEGDLIA